MTTLVEAMLEVARVMGLTYEGTATSGATTSLTDTSLDMPADYFAGGTVWILSGTQAGSCKVVKTHDGNTVTFDAYSATVGTPNYALANADYPKQLLKQAVLDVLRFDECLLKNDTLTITADTEEYTLPTGVSNVVSVQIANNDDEPYSFTDHFYWREYDGKLIFDRGKYPTKEGYIIRIWYSGYHGEIAETGTTIPSIEPTVPIKWLVWKAVENVYRKKYKNLVKNHPEEVDLLNEAKENVRYAQMSAEKYELRSGNPTPRLANY